MADIVHPEAKYKIQQIGPVSDWSFNDKQSGNKVEMKGYSVQFEGIADWITINQKADGVAPKVGDELEGHVEDGGSFGFKFVKKRAGGNWSGGGKSSPGAQWSAAFDTAANIVSGYYAASGTKPKDIQEYLGRIEQVAPVVKAKVDALAGTAKTEETQKSETETGESPAPAGNNAVVIEDVDEKELGKW